jgi:hypothetical protein
MREVRLQNLPLLPRPASGAIRAGLQVQQVPIRPDEAGRGAGPVNSRPMMAAVTEPRAYGAVSKVTNRASAHEP